ncbi:MAG: helix-hairpin-helix domain-containing protein [Symbiobacteriia bacterium]
MSERANERTQRSGLGADSGFGLASGPAGGPDAGGLLTGWSRPELLAVAALLLVLVSGTAWLAWDRLGGWGGNDAPAGATASAVARKGAGPAGSGTTAGGAPGGGMAGDAAAANGSGSAEGGAGGGEGSAAAAEITVHVAGAVLHPGVYRLPAGSRTVGAVTAAGGQRADGRSDLLNLAALLVDGDKVYVPAQREVDGATPGTGTGSAGSGWALPGRGGKVDVNHADLPALETLPGVGPSLAGSILRYRQEHGPFQRVEDMEKVPGIGPAKLAALRDQVVLR